jgi:hypothetical protein
VPALSDVEAQLEDVHRYLQRRGDLGNSPDRHTSDEVQRQVQLVAGGWRRAWRPRSAAVAPGKRLAHAPAGPQGDEQAHRWLYASSALRRRLGR